MPDYDLDWSVVGFLELKKDWTRSAVQRAAEASRDRPDQESGVMVAVVVLEHLNISMVILGAVASRERFPS